MFSDQVFVLVEGCFEDEMLVWVVGIAGTIIGNVIKVSLENCHCVVDVSQSL
jgi:hypothetical protein